MIPGFPAVWVLTKIFGLSKELGLSVGPKLEIVMPLGGLLLNLTAGSFIRVLLMWGDSYQVAFETDRIAGGAVSVYLPVAPNPWPGSVIFVSPETKVNKLAVSVPEALTAESA